MAVPAVGSMGDLRRGHRPPEDARQTPPFPTLAQSAQRLFHGPELARQRVMKGMGSREGDHHGLEPLTPPPDQKAVQFIPARFADRVGATGAKPDRAAMLKPYEVGARLIAIPQDHPDALSRALKRPTTGPEALFVRQQSRRSPAVAHPNPPSLPPTLGARHGLINGIPIYTKRSLKRLAVKNGLRIF